MLDAPARGGPGGNPCRSSLPPLERNGYPLHQEGPDALVFGHSSRGHSVSVRFRDLGDRRALVLVHGVAPLGVRRAFAKLAE